MPLAVIWGGPVIVAGVLGLSRLDWRLSSWPGPALAYTVGVVAEIQAGSGENAGLGVALASVLALICLGMWALSRGVRRLLLTWLGPGGRSRSG